MGLRYRCFVQMFCTDFLRGGIEQLQGNIAVRRDVVTKGVGRLLAGFLTRGDSD
jgi:hypothetical protein